MTVAELIAELAKVDPSTMVVVDGYEGDYDTPRIRTVYVVPGKGTGQYFGEHADVLAYEEGAVVACGLLRRFTEP